MLTKEQRDSLFHRLDWAFFHLHNSRMDSTYVNEEEERKNTLQVLRAQAELFCQTVEKIVQEQLAARAPQEKPEEKIVDLFKERGE